MRHIQYTTAITTHQMRQMRTEFLKSDLTRNGSIAFVPCMNARLETPIADGFEFMLQLSPSKRGVIRVVQERIDAPPLLASFIEVANGSMEHQFARLLRLAFSQVRLETDEECARLYITPIPAFDLLLRNMLLVSNAATLALKRSPIMSACRQLQAAELLGIEVSDAPGIRGGIEEMQRYPIIASLQDQFTQP